jgi:hypothetical protein
MVCSQNALRSAEFNIEKCSPSHPTPANAEFRQLEHIIDSTEPERRFEPA